MKTFAEEIETRLACTIAELLMTENTLKRKARGTTRASWSQFQNKADAEHYAETLRAHKRNKKIKVAEVPGAERPWSTNWEYTGRKKTH